MRVMKEAHDIRQPVKRLVESTDPAETAVYRETMDRALRLFDDAWASAPEWSLGYGSLLEKRFAEEHEKFLRANHPRLYRNLSQSGKLQAHLTSTAETAAEMFTHEMFKKVEQTKDLDPLAQEKQLRGHREAMMELVRHDLIWKPTPKPPDE
jgi:hypothetical protein